MSGAPNRLKMEVKEVCSCFPDNQFQKMVRLTITTWVIILAGVSANKLSTQEKTKTKSTNGVSAGKRTTNGVSAIGVSALKASAYGVSKGNMSTNKVSAEKVSAISASAVEESASNVSAEMSADMLGHK